MQQVTTLLTELRTLHEHPRLAQLQQGLPTALTPWTATYRDLQEGAQWLRDIARYLTAAPESPPAPPHTGAQVAQQLRDYLDALLARTDLAPPLVEFGQHLDKVSRSYWPGLFHCYNQPGLPRTNNALEGDFREL